MVARTEHWFDRHILWFNAALRPGGSPGRVPLKLSSICRKLALASGRSITDAAAGLAQRDVETRDQRRRVERLGQESHRSALQRARPDALVREGGDENDRDRKSTRLNSSHLGISYAVFC